jgi:hypothetical protein
MEELAEGEADRGESTPEEPRGEGSTGPD